jgi:hypothetical protein
MSHQNLPKDHRDVEEEERKRSKAIHQAMVQRRLVSMLFFITSAFDALPTPPTQIFLFAIEPEAHTKTAAHHTSHRPLAHTNPPVLLLDERKKMYHEASEARRRRKKIIKGNNGALMASSQAWKAHRRAVGGRETRKII